MLQSITISRSNEWPGLSAITSSADSSVSVAFLLSQVGAHSSSRFAERLEPLGLKPPHVGILTVVAQADGLSQQALGETLGAFPSRLVGIIDELEEKGLVERRNSPTDRRSYALYLTGAGREVLEQIGRVGRAHQDALCASRSDAKERGCAARGPPLADRGRAGAHAGRPPGLSQGRRGRVQVAGDDGERTASARA